MTADPNVTSPEALARLVGLGALDSPTLWPKYGCVAWVDSRDSRCGRDRAEGWLCRRHHRAAVDRWHEALVAARDRQQQRAEERARLLPGWRKRLARIEAEIARLDPPPATTDMAAYGGAVHTSIQRQRLGALSDTRVERMARLHREADALRTKIGDDQ